MYFSIFKDLQILVFHFEVEKKLNLHTCSTSVTSQSVLRSIGLGVCTLLLHIMDSDENVKINFFAQLKSKTFFYNLEHLWIFSSRCPGSN